MTSMFSRQPTFNSNGLGSILNPGGQTRFSTANSQATQTAQATRSFRPGPNEPTYKLFTGTKNAQGQDLFWPVRGSIAPNPDVSITDFPDRQQQEKFYHDAKKRITSILDSFKGLEGVESELFMDVMRERYPEDAEIFTNAKSNPSRFRRQMTTTASGFGTTRSGRFGTNRGSGFGTSRRGRRSTFANSTAPSNTTVESQFAQRSRPRLGRRLSKLFGVNSEPDDWVTNLDEAYPAWENDGVTFGLLPDMSGQTNDWFEVPFAQDEQTAVQIISEGLSKVVMWKDDWGNLDYHIQDDANLEDYVVNFKDLDDEEEENWFSEWESVMEPTVVETWKDYLEWDDSDNDSGIDVSTPLSRSRRRFGNVFGGM